MARIGCAEGRTRFGLGKQETAETSIFIFSTSLELAIEDVEDGRMSLKKVRRAWCWPVIVVGKEPGKERVSREPKPRTPSFFFGIGEESLAVVAPIDGSRRWTLCSTSEWEEMEGKMMVCDRRNGGNGELEGFN